MEEGKGEAYKSTLKIWTQRAAILVPVSAIVTLVLISFWQDSRASYQTILQCINSNFHSIKSGPCVKSLQDILNVKHRACESSLPLLVVNGNFNDATKKALSEYQTANSIDATGEPDLKTLENLIANDKLCLASKVSTLNGNNRIVTTQPTNTSVIDVKGWKNLGSVEIDLSTSKLSFTLSMCRTSDYKIKLKSSIDSTNVPSSYHFSAGAVDKDDNIIVDTAQIGAGSIATVESGISQSPVSKDITLRGQGYVGDSSTDAGSYTAGILVSELYVCE